MPTIDINMMPGRTIDQKRNLVREVTRIVCETINTTPDRVKISLSEMNPENYAVSGKLLVDHDDSFKQKK